MMEKSNLFAKTNSKNWKNIISNFNQLWKLGQYGIIFLASAFWNIKNKRPANFRNLWKMKTIQSPKHEQLRTTEKIVEQGKVVKNGRRKIQRKQKLFF